MPVKRHPIAAAQPQHTSLLGAIPLDTGVVQRLRTSYDQVRACDLRLAEVFYAKLFAAAPHLRGMFRADPLVQCEKLMLALDAVVRNLEQPEANAAMLSALGRRHAAYGAKPEHYALVTQLLVDSMREVLESAAADSLSEWRAALDLISRQMIEAAQDA